MNVIKLAIFLAAVILLFVNSYTAFKLAAFGHAAESWRAGLWAALMAFCAWLMARKRRRA